MNLQGRCALVTGGARRVGRAICLELARAGCDVVVHYHRSESAARSLADLIDGLHRRCHLIRGDLGDPETPFRVVSGAVHACGRLDLVINNAAIFEPSRLDHFDADHWARTFQINVVAPAHLCHHAAPHLRRTSGGVVNLADISAERPWPGHLAYCASKAALINLTRSLAKALAPDVRVNAVSPGIAVFPDHYDDATRAKLIAEVPMRRAGEPEDIARLVRFLCANAGYITGQVLNLDGGRSIA